MKFDDVLFHLGEFGRYQKLLYFLTSLAVIPCSLVTFSNIFLSASPGHQCSYYPNQSYIDDVRLANCLFPWDKQKESWSECYKFSNISQPENNNSCTAEDVSRYDVIACDEGLVYDTKFYGSTVVTEWNLVCDYDWMKQVSKSIMLVGNAVSSVIFGIISDVYGRKPALLIAVIAITGCGFVSTFSPTFWCFCFMQMGIGFASNGVFVVVFVIGTELVGKSWRSFTGIVIQYFYSSGMLLLVLISSTLRNWRPIQLTLSVISACLFIIQWLLPESPRWLLSKGRTAEAEKIIRNAAKVNKVTLPDNLFEESSDGKYYFMFFAHDLLSSKDIGLSVLVTSIALPSTTDAVVPPAKFKYAILQLIRSPELRKNTNILCLNWATNSIAYYGLLYQSETLGNNPYMSVLYAVLVDFPAIVVLQFLGDRVDRRKLVCGLMMTAGVFLLGSTVIPKHGYETLILVCMLVGKMCILCSYSLAYILAAEIYPTPVRNVGLGICVLFARVGGIVAPYVIFLGDVISVYVPFVVFGTLSIVASILTLFLPATLGKYLPDTLEDAENMSREAVQMNSNEYNRVDSNDIKETEQRVVIQLNAE